MFKVSKTQQISNDISINWDIISVISEKKYNLYFYT